MSSATVNALLARGVDSSTAQRVSDKNYTIAKLKQLPSLRLIKLGISKDIARQLFHEARPPIPETTLHKVLYASQRTCCVCRNSNLPIVVHHIIPWAKSKDHSERNLAVLCLNHHHDAHTSGGLAHGLKPTEIRSAKQNWERTVKELDARAVLGLMDASEYSRFDWLNLQRMSDLFLQLSIPYRDIPVYSRLRAAGYVDQHGLLTPQERWGQTPRFWFLDFGDGMYVAHYLTEITKRILQKLPIVNITNHLTRTALQALLRTGTFFVVERPFYFRSLAPRRKTRAQLRRRVYPKRIAMRAYSRGHGIWIRFVYNAFHCLSMSARSDSMSGHKVITAICQLRSATEGAEGYTLDASCLAVGSHFASSRPQRVPLVAYIKEADYLDDYEPIP